MFTGLSAFPLTPLNGRTVDESAFERLVGRLVEANVDSIGALGSTGSYAYLSRAERARVTELAVRNAGDVPVIAGISALSTLDVLQYAEDVQKAGAKAVLLSPMSYQKLNDEEVYNLYKTVTSQLSVPLCVYDNPGTTNFQFTDELHGRIAQLSNVRSIKIPGVPASLEQARTRVDQLRSKIPAHVTIGVSGDASAAMGLNVGCDAWYSVIGGLFPHTARELLNAAQEGSATEATRLSERLQPLWSLFGEAGGSIRVIAAAAEIVGLVNEPCLPAPLKSVSGDLREKLARVIHELQLH